jgi:mRNA interferase HigB
MRIIARPILIDYWEKHRQEKSSLENWYKVVQSAVWTRPDDIKKTFNSVDPFRHNNRLYHIFDVGGNNTRVIVNIHFNTKIVYIRCVLTHDEYSKDKWKDTL